MVKDVHLHSLLNLADLVIVRNSTVGLEGLILGKPVICLGRSAYSGKGFTYDVEKREYLQEMIDCALSAREPFPPNRHEFLVYLACLLRGYHFDLSQGDKADSYNQVFIARSLEGYEERDLKLREAETEGLREAGSFKVIAIISARNEGDIIFHVMGALIREGVAVYLIDHNSDDDTVSEASKWLGKGLMGIESFPDHSRDALPDGDLYEWGAILKRKESLAAELDGDWFIHHDADEFRESPWPGLSLLEALRKADSLGYNAVDFELLNFRPIDNEFQPGDDVREHLRYYEPGDAFDKGQIKAWKKQSTRVDLESTGGHEAQFEGREVFPIKFILRHYPVRSQSHGEKKVFEERKARFVEGELARGWHIQYDDMKKGHSFLSDPGRLALYDGGRVRLGILGTSADAVAPASDRHETALYVRELEREIAGLEDRLEGLVRSRGFRMLSVYYRMRDRILSGNEKRRERPAKGRARKAR